MKSVEWTEQRNRDQMIKLSIISPKKTKEPWLEEAIAEYEKRLSPSVKISWHFVKDDDQLKRALPKSYFCLNPEGEEMTSIAFSSFLERESVKGGSSLCFVIGGPEGIPEDVLENHLQVSLSKMTFTHQLVRLIFIEQVYRALEISKGSQYHK